MTVETPRPQGPPGGSRAGRTNELTEIRASRPGAIAEAAARRVRRERLLGPSGRLMLLAADHPARGALAAGGDPMAMADRGDLLDRLCLALARPGVDGVLGTPDVLEDLLLLGALDGKVVIGSMNRGGLAGASFEIDDRFTAYDAAALAAARLDGGKMLLRLDDGDPATAGTLERCAHAVSALAAQGLMAMVEPFVSHRVDGRVRNVLTPEAMIRAISVATGLGVTSARTWLKVPVVPDMERVMAASTLPALLLGGEVAGDPRAALAGWRRALRLPTVKGLVVGRSLLYPSDGDVAAAVDAAVEAL
ncbi:MULTISPECIES: Cgl0159 family (beta/alpha)8-fold protein [Thermomonosporaceae]|uniref:Cgl0159 family (beta/alpha)8-fold protein n=1 Tax=Thermomonosporaceae TaxID=2012 RepID=UPI00255B3CB7|nr:MULTISPECIES: aldolase [Thermomonosporaceae]MDL4774291.1 aldolase [Actinomadura xylanilytica]